MACEAAMLLLRLLVARPGWCQENAAGAAVRSGCRERLGGGPADARARRAPHL